MIMSKPAEAQFAIHDLLRQRWSPLAFADRPVEPEKLRSLLEAARWAPSSYNEQPWTFVLALRENREEFDRMLGCLAAGNIPWASAAPALMLSVAKLYFDHNRKANRHAFHDVGLATENLMLQAVSLGLYVHAMAGFDPAMARERYRIPADHEPVAMMAFGYKGETESLPTDYRERETGPRSRKPIADFVFAGEWGRTAAVI